MLPCLITNFHPLILHEGWREPIPSCLLTSTRAQWHACLAHTLTKSMIFLRETGLFGGLFSAHSCSTLLHSVRVRQDTMKIHVAEENHSPQGSGSPGPSPGHIPMTLSTQKHSSYLKEDKREFTLESNMREHGPRKPQIPCSNMKAVS